MADEFRKWKENNRKANDLSRKGAIDAPIVDLINEINVLDQYFTTSSCSGRVIVFEQEGDSKKKGCKWLLVSHEKILTSTVVVDCLKDLTGEAVMKFEPFVLHVQCQSLDCARLLHSVAVASGFRNSGITVGKHGSKIICAVRSTHGLEVPLSSCGKLLVSEEYVKFLVDCANEKMAENFIRIQRFPNNFRDALAKRTTSATTRKHQNRDCPDLHKSPKCQSSTTDCEDVDCSDITESVSCLFDVR